MINLKKITCLVFVTLAVFAAHSQGRWSFSTDFNIFHNFKKQQHYWAIGQSVVVHFHATPKDGMYGWLTYHSNGTFKNRLTAQAFSPLTTPQQVEYMSRSKMRFREICFGWRHYLQGASDAEEGLNVFTDTGLGLMFGSVQNTHSVMLDTATYDLPVLSGKGSFRRLTLDLAIGVEKPVGGDIFVYSEAKLFIPVSSYPTRYLRVSNYAPLTGCVSVGVRILF